MRPEGAAKESASGVEQVKEKESPFVSATVYCTDSSGGRGGHGCTPFLFTIFYLLQKNNN